MHYYDQLYGIFNPGAHWRFEGSYGIEDPGVQ